MELTKEKVIRVVVSMVVIASLGLYIFLYRPLINGLKTASSKCKSSEDEVSRVRELIAPLKIMNIKRSLIREETVALAINELTRQAKLEGINFLSMEQKKVKRPKGISYKVLPIEIELVATYEKLGVFLGILDILEKSLVTVKSFDVILDKNDVNALKTKMVFNIYIMDEKNAR